VTVSSEPADEAFGTGAAADEVPGAGMQPPAHRTVRDAREAPRRVSPVTEREQARDALTIAVLTASAVAASTATPGGVTPVHVDVALVPHPAVATLVGCLGVATVTPALVRIDVERRRLPNALVGVVAVAWVASLVVFVVQGGVVAATTSFGCVIATAVAGLVVALAGGVGMGDVKLGALLSGLVSPWGSMALLSLWGLAGASALALAAMRRADASSRHTRRRARPARLVADVPFGPCLLGAFWAIVVGRPVLAALVDVSSTF